MQINAKAFAGGKHPSATDLRKFFQACADACTPYDATPANASDASVKVNK